MPIVFIKTVKIVVIDGIDVILIDQLLRLMRLIDVFHFDTTFFACFQFVRSFLQRMPNFKFSGSTATACFHHLFCTSALHLL